MKTYPHIIVSLILIFILESCGLNDPSFHAEKYRYYNDVVKLDIKSGGRTVLQQGISAMPAADGDIIVLDDKGKMKIYNSAGNEKQSLAGDLTAAAINISPDGSEVLITATYNGKLEEGTYISYPGIYSVSSSGTGLKRLTDYSNIYDTDPSYSTNMEKIVFTRQYSIAVMDSSGGSVQIIKQSIDTSYYKFPRFSPDSKSIYYLVREERAGNIYSLRKYNLPEGSDSLILKDITSPAGLFVSQGGFVLLRTEKAFTALNNSGAILYTRQASSVFMTNDGIVAYTDENNTIYSCNADGSGTTAIFTEPGGTVYSPVLSMDGSTLLYIVQRRVNNI